MPRAAAARCRRRAGDWPEFEHEEDAGATRRSVAVLERGVERTSSARRTRCHRAARAAAARGGSAVPTPSRRGSRRPSARSRTARGARSRRASASSHHMTTACYSLQRCSASRCAAASMAGAVGRRRRTSRAARPPLEPCTSSARAATPRQRCVAWRCARGAAARRGHRALLLPPGRGLRGVLPLPVPARPRVGRRRRGAGAVGHARRGPPRPRVRRDLPDAPHARLRRAVARGAGAGRGARGGGRQRAPRPRVGLQGPQRAQRPEGRRLGAAALRGAGGRPARARGGGTKEATDPSRSTWTGLRRRRRRGGRGGGLGRRGEDAGAARGDDPRAAGVATGVDGLDRLLDAFAAAAAVKVKVHCRGDRHIDDHHSAEDVAISLGQCLHEAVGDKAGLRRMAARRGVGACDHARRARPVEPAARDVGPALRRGADGTRRRARATSVERAARRLAAHALVHSARRARPHAAPGLRRRRRPAGPHGEPGAGRVGAFGAASGRRRRRPPPARRRGVGRGGPRRRNHRKRPVAASWDFDSGPLSGRSPLAWAWHRTTTRPVAGRARGRTPAPAPALDAEEGEEGECGSEKRCPLQPPALRAGLVRRLRTAAPRGC